MYFIIFGLIAVAFAFLNLVRFSLGKSYKQFMFLSLAYTCLTTSVALLEMIGYGDTELVDVFLPMGNVFMVCTIMSIFINAIPLFAKRD